MMKRLMAALLAAALLLLTVPGFGTRAEAAQKGIDVSQWQGAINWQAVKAGGADFAMIRIGNCKYGLDTRFAENMIGASAAGLRVGCYVYTYATNVQEAIADATLAVQAMAPFQVSFPVAIDMEDSVHKTLNPLQQAEIVNAFCSVIYQAGYSPMVYASWSGWARCRGTTGSRCTTHTAIIPASQCGSLPAAEQFRALRAKWTSTICLRTTLR